MKEAVAKIGLPGACEKLTLPAGLKKGENIILGDDSGDCVYRGTGDLPAGVRLIVGRKLNPNKDSEADLALLPGIGEVKARRIVEDRAENGPFEDLDDLTRVLGIGKVTVRRLDPWLEWE